MWARTFTTGFLSGGVGECHPAVMRLAPADPAHTLRQVIVADTFEVTQAVTRAEDHPQPALLVVLVHAPVVASIVIATAEVSATIFVGGMNPPEVAVSGLLPFSVRVLLL